jgi:putative two-component system response regulator
MELQALESFRILAVSQDESFQDEVSRYLAPFGYKVERAAGSLQALEAIRSQRPDMVLAEVDIPPLDGFELCRSLKQDPVFRHIPFVLVTDSYFDVDSKAKGLSMGADDLLYRPLHGVELRARVRSSLRLKAQVETFISHQERLEELVQDRTREIQEIAIGVVAALEKANTMNDTDTGSHIRRVSEYSSLVARGLELDTGLVDRIDRYASLHDVGKVGLPDSILKKEGRLTAEEFDLMKSHTTLGFELLKEARADNVACRIALHHHERYDGTGYPEGLSGARIPIEARIVALADVFDALTTKRCYKDAIPPEKASTILMEESGKHFDPAMVRIYFEFYGDFLKILEEHGD